MCPPKFFALEENGLGGGPLAYHVVIYLRQRDPMRAEGTAINAHECSWVHAPPEKALLAGSETVWHVSPLLRGTTTDQDSAMDQLDGKGERAIDDNCLGYTTRTYGIGWE